MGKKEARTIQDVILCLKKNKLPNEAVSKFQQFWLDLQTLLVCHDSMTLMTTQDTFVVMTPIGFLMSFHVIYDTTQHTQHMTQNSSTTFANPTKIQWVSSQQKCHVLSSVTLNHDTPTTFANPINICEIINIFACDTINNTNYSHPSTYFKCP